MQKTLLLMRHAKSSWDEPKLADAERPLNSRGRRDAPRMGRALGALPDRILSSPAVRARTTALLVAEAAQYTGPIVFDARIYEAGVRELVQVTRDQPDACQRLLLVGHNPGLEDWVSAFALDRPRFPTGALAEIELMLARWSDLSPSTPGRLLRLVRPKELR